MPETNTDPRKLEVLKAVAAYWGGFLRKPGSVRYDNGASDLSGVMMTLLAAEQPDASDTEADRFEAVLLAKLVKRPLMSLDCDYGPCRALADAAEEADCMPKFPWKTDTYIVDEGLRATVSAGYAAPDVDIIDLRSDDDKRVAWTANAEYEDGRARENRDRAACQYYSREELDGWAAASELKAAELRAKVAELAR